MIKVYHYSLCLSTLYRKNLFENPNGVCYNRTNNFGDEETEGGDGMRESGENYLETILLLQKKLGCVRSIDIANRLDYSKPSVSRAMSILKKQDYITMDKSGFIELTDKGLQKAKEIYERHILIQEFLIETLGVEPDIAEQDACRIEHIISTRTFDRIREYVEEHRQ